jgi:glutaredoxin-related protein
MKVEAEILERQLQYRLAHFAKPDDATVRKAILKNERRILAVYLHTRAGYGGAALARFFKVPRSTAYGWIDWFKSLPEGLRDGIKTFSDWPTIPQLYVKGEFVGGSDIVREMFNAGELQALMAEKGVPLGEQAEA